MVQSYIKTNCLRALWNYGLPNFAKIMQLTATNAGGFDGITPFGALTGKTPDISQYLDFGFYDWVTFRSNAGLGKAELGRWIGVSH